MTSSRILPPTAISCIFIVAIQQVRHLKKATKRTKGKLEESNKNWHRKQGVQSKKSSPSHKLFYVLFSVTQSLFLLSFSRSPDNITASNKKSTSKKQHTSVCEIIFAQKYNSTTLSIWVVYIQMYVNKFNCA